MSKNNQVITISPPMFIGEGNQKSPAKATGVAIATVTVSFGERNNGNG